MSTALSPVEPPSSVEPMTRPPPDPKLAFLVASGIVMRLSASPSTCCFALHALSDR